MKSRIGMFASLALALSVPFRRAARPAPPPDAPVVFRRSRRALQPFTSCPQRADYRDRSKAESMALLDAAEAKRQRKAAKRLKDAAHK